MSRMITDGITVHRKRVGRLEAMQRRDRKGERGGRHVHRSCIDATETFVVTVTF